jgi:nitrogen fixation protein NifU and related proteins
MSDLRELYQELIIDHGYSPRNFGTLAEANYSKEGYNPLCGDKLTLQMIISDDVIQDVKFKGAGCAISTASASLMTESLIGKSLDEFREIFSNFHELITGDNGHINEEKLGKLVVLGGVAQYPSRVKCATLAWHTAKACVEKSEELVCTE